MGSTLRKFQLLTFTIFLAAPPLMAENEYASAAIMDLGFQDLQEIEVTSVSKREDKLIETAAAVYIITSEDIRRSGATTIPEVLRLAPGLQVARSNSSTYAISARGFNGTIANKLLVLIDGRSVYTPLYSGVFWDVQNVLLDNVERIEVIRGPGASVWGANAVNGVINIIRKPSAETQGGRISAGGGTEIRSNGNFRYGGKIGETGHYRAQVQYFEMDDMRAQDGTEAQDAWHMTNGGFRMDFQPSTDDSFMVSMDAYDGKEEQFAPVNRLTPPYRSIHHDQTDVNGGNVMGRWSKQLATHSNLQLQFFYDRTKRHIPLSFEEIRDTYDTELQHQFHLGSKQNLIWGLGFRISDDRVQDSFSPAFDPESFTSELFSAFFQDEIRINKKLIFTLGSRFEHNDYTGFEIQPNARLAWLVTPRNTLWTSVSRAVRTPTRFENDIRIQAVVAPAPLTAISFRGDDMFDSEELIAYELGYRAQPNSRTWLDLATFYNVYDNLRTAEPGSIFLETDPAPSHFVAPYYWRNKAKAESYGVEFSPQQQLTDWWRIQAQYSYLHLRMHLEEGSMDTVTLPTEKSDPVHQASLRTAFNLPLDFELDGGVRYVDELEDLNVGSYTVFDVRIGYRGIRNVDLEVVGQDLSRNYHREFSSSSVEHSVFGKATWSF